LAPSTVKRFGIKAFDEVKAPTASVAAEELVLALAV
jgi:hypothetical protein